MKFFLMLFLLFAGVALLVRFAQATEVPAVGTSAPNFNLPDQHGKMHKLADYKSSWLVLYFYPKDDTPGCTEEACMFRDDLAQISKMGGKVVGISIDDTRSHAEFAEKYHLPFPLLADKDGSVAKSYGAVTNLLFMKIAKRYTFLVDPEGQVAKVYLSVDTSRHSVEIIRDLSLLVK